MNDDPELKELIRRIQAGNSPAMGELQERLNHKLLPYIRTKIGPTLLARIDAEDVIQQTLLEIYFIIRHTHRPIRNLDLLCRAVARNIISAHGRRRSTRFRRVTLNQDDSNATNSPDALPADPSVVFERLVLSERDDLIKRAILSLKPEQTRIVILRFFHRDRKPATFRQIGEILGKTPEATEKAYLRATKLLKKFIERERRTSTDSRF